MNSLDSAQSLANRGLFEDALVALDVRGGKRDVNRSASLLRAELLERTGRYESASQILHALLKQAKNDDSGSAHCHLILGRIAAANGLFETAIGHLQRSITSSLLRRDFERAAWAQLRLLLVLFDASGPEAVGPLVSQLRATSARAADARVLSALHLHLAEMESKRGALSSAERHLHLANKLLETHPNTWLEAMLAQSKANLSCLKLDFRAGILHAERAAHLSAKSGWAEGASTSAATLGNLYLFTGRLEEAANCCERALSLMVPGSDNFSGTIETLARIRLLQGRIDECDALLNEIDSFAAKGENTRRRFVYRHSLLTRVRALHYRGDGKQAAQTLDEVMRLASETRDEWLMSSARLAKTQLFAEASRLELVTIFDDLTKHIALRPLDRHAALEHAFATGLTASGEAALARRHISRARTIYQAVDHNLGLVEMAVCPTLSTLGTPSSAPQVEVGAEPGRDRVESRLLQDLAAIVNHAGSWRLFASELLTLISASDCVESAIAVCSSADGDEEVIAAYRPDGHFDYRLERRIQLGIERGRNIELIVRPKADIESLATLKAVTTILSALQELEHARTEREERSTIWPAEEGFGDCGNFVISGHMREIMTLAQKVARTTVHVLITGESGTGKEIVARALHTYSTRAHKPYVAFNCSAIPRDLIESQLFGHRRGAFTGADHDYPGVIRAARDGTLFLDEIGDLALDLQPKLLRFLESREIAPLGDAHTHQVDVRIVAATNANLEQAVRDGRFREDLFYRLNVVRLPLNPLRERRDEIPGLVNAFVAQAAADFGKGRLEIAEETMERLLLYRWPGNIRQLQNEIRRMVALAEPDSTVEPDLISHEIIEAMPIFRRDPGSRHELAVRLSDKLVPTLLRVEVEMIKAALRDNHGKVDAVARALGISRKGLYLKRQRLGL